MVGSFFILGALGWHIGLYGMFKKAGVEGWKAFVPFYNTLVHGSKSGIGRTWFWLQLIPIAGQFVTIWITIIFVMHFGKFTVLQHAAAVFPPVCLLAIWAFSKKLNGAAPKRNETL